MIHVGLRTKFIALIFVTLAVLLGVIAFIQVRSTSNSLRRDLNNQSKLFASLATKPIGDAFLVYKDSGTEKITEQTARFNDLNPEVANIGVVSTSGQSLFSEKADQSLTVSASQAASFESVSNYDKAGYIHQIISPYLEDSGAHRFNLVFQFSSASVVAQIAQTERSILVATVLGLGLSAALTFLLVDWLFLRPISRLSRQALVISAGNLNQQISITNQDEIGDLAAAVNKMSESLKTDITKLTEVDHLKSEFMMITSHNLRTPLTIINGYIELLTHDPKVPLSLQKSIKLIEVNIQRLGAFTEDMLAISRVESGQDIMTKEPTKLVEFLAELTQEFKVLTTQKKITFTTNLTPGDYEVQMNKAHLRSAMWNLLDNALKFTKAGGQISLATRLSAQSAIITVTDTGVGIAPAEMPKLFTKFHRGTSTLEYEYEGTGIGLYATRLVISRHNGTITAKSELGKGSVFTVELPLLPGGSIST